MDVEQMKHTIGGMIYELSAIMARLGEHTTDAEEERMLELIHLISVLDSSLIEYIEDQAVVITKEIFREAFSRT